MGTLTFESADEERDCWTWAGTTDFNVACSAIG